jgi:hypothetical protein
MSQDSNQGESEVVHLLIASIQQRIAEQKLFIVELRQGGHDTASAKEVLQELEDARLQTTAAMDGTNSAVSRQSPSG